MSAVMCQLSNSGSKNLPLELDIKIVNLLYLLTSFGSVSFSYANGIGMSKTFFSKNITSFIDLSGICNARPDGCNIDPIYVGKICG